MVAGGVFSNAVCLWETSTGKLLERFSGHEDDIEDISFHPNGTLLASVDRTGVIRTWSPASMKQTESRGSGKSPEWPAAFRGQPSRAWSLDFSPNGKQLLSANVGSHGSIRTWHPRQPKKRFLHLPAELMSIHFTTATNCFFVSHGFRENGDPDPHLIRIWDQGKEPMLREFPRPYDHRHWFKSRVHAQTTIVSEDSIISGHLDGSVLTRNIATGELLQSFQAHDATVSSLTLSNDGGLIVSVSTEEGTVKLWDAVTGGQLSSLQFTSPHLTTAISPDNRILAVGTGNQIAFIDTNSGNETDRLSGHLNTVRCLKFSPDGHHLLSGSDDRSLRIWDVQSKALRYATFAHHARVTSLAFSPNGRTIVSGDTNGMIAFTQTMTGRVLFTVDLLKHWPETDTPSELHHVDGLSFSGDGTLLAAVVRNRGIVFLEGPSNDTSAARDNMKKTQTEDKKKLKTKTGR